MALDAFYRTPLLIDRIRKGPAGEVIERFAGALADHRYSQRRACELLRAARHLSQWANSRGLPLIDLTAEDVSDYARHAAHCRCLGHVTGRRAYLAERRACVVLGYLQRGSLGVRSDCRRKQPPQLVQEFLRWMAQNRGLREASLAMYKKALVTITAALGDDPERYTATTVRRFIMACGVDRAPSSTERIIAALRAYIRFLTAEGKCSDFLGGAIPRFRRPHGEPPPDVLSPKEVERVLAATKPVDLLSIRDRAALLLLLRLGLRTGDVAALRFSDVLWNRGMLRVAGKGRQAGCIPLPQDVGDALLAYTSARPKIATDTIFLRVRAPVRPFASCAAVTQIWCRALRRAGVRNPAPGKQLLRHTAATHLARAGLRPESVATILRHRSISTTAHYIHADPRSMKGLVQPWPLEFAH